MNDASEKTPSRPRIGGLLVKMGFVTSDDVEKALDIQKKYEEYANMPLGLFLLEKGVLAKTDAERFIAHPEVREDLRAALLEAGVPGEASPSNGLGEKGQEDPVSAGLVTEDPATHRTGLRLSLNM